jgi:uncharacterized protein
MRVAITGATGLVGTELRRQLGALGHEVTPVVRNLGSVPRTERAVVWQPDRGAIDADALDGHDVVVHLAGESIAGVWTPGRKRRIRESRVQGTALLARALAGLGRQPRALFSASGFNFYGDRGNREVDESSPAGEGFLAEVARDWEAATAPAVEAGIRVVNMRFGTVLGRDGGMLPVLLPMFRLGLGAQLGSGDQAWPWIAVDEIPPALLHVLERPEIAGPVNFVAPQVVTNREFTETLADVLGRPAPLRVPAFAARLAPGGMADEVLLGGARVLPRKLLDSGYAFRHPELRTALRAVLAG